METANELLRNWRDIKISQKRGDKAQAKPQYQQYNEPQAHTHVASPSMDAGVGAAMDRMKIGGPEPGPPVIDYSRPISAPPSSERYSQDGRFYQGGPSPPPQPQQLPPQQQPPPQQIPPYGPQQPRPPPGARVAVPPNYPPQADPMQGRMSSSYDMGPPPPPQGDMGYGPSPGGYQVRTLSYSSRVLCIDFVCL